MKIESIGTFIIHEWLVVRVTTDSGLTGVGEATFWAQPPATETVVHSFREALIGKDPLTIDHPWLSLYRSSSFRGASINAALSAIDIALWDVAGKHYGAPVHALLGGAHRNKIRMCALSMSGDVDEMVRSSIEAVKEGHTAVKIDPLPSEFPTWTFARMMKEVVERVGTVREAVGPDVDVCVEFHRKTVPAEAIALAQKLAQFDVLFIEDPAQPDSIDTMAEISRRSPVPIATGERFNNMYEFRELLQKGGAQVLKIDVGLHGGFSQTKKIAAIAESYHATVSPHNAWGPVLTAAHVQLCAAVPNFQVLEYRPDEPPKSEMVKEPLPVKDGYIDVPDTPGIGVEFNEAAPAKYPPAPRTISTLRRPDGSVAFG